MDIRISVIILVGETLIAAIVLIGVAPAAWFVWAALAQDQQGSG